MMRYMLLPAAALMMLSAPALAADLGGECCADLEERIGDLEAAAARKGNRKMSLVISGEVNQAWSRMSFGPFEDSGLVDNGSFINISGEGSVRAGASIGYHLEIGLDAISGTVEANKGFIWFNGEIGTLSIGQAGHASDGTGETTVANTKVAAKLLNAFGGSIDDGDTAGLIRYDSPAIGPLAVSASWGADDEWSAALRFATETGGFRIAAAAGYFADDFDYDVVLVSGGIKHMASGLFAQAAYATSAGDDAMHIQGGVEKDFSGFGATTVFAEYGQITIGSVDLDGYGIGAVQAFDAAATDVYVSYRSSADIDVEAFTAGIRLKF